VESGHLNATASVQAFGGRQRPVGTVVKGSSRKSLIFMIFADLSRFLLPSVGEAARQAGAFNVFRFGRNVARFGGITSELGGASPAKAGCDKSHLTALYRFLSHPIAPYRSLFFYFTRPNSTAIAFSAFNSSTEAVILARAKSFNSKPGTIWSF
jgi:hypothetical protein